ncbi:rhomboid family intramembrane serine protease [candidate division LCP-89 bacterium B3_LCP]|uniref:Rhomboid family intramembrane serine protease n=1 Tax=candidate division LCP-89 bacterium B3_LCP TaxID=2012998 RepID=A0A532V5L4_UNCL8|nr:MAG: rhomboid family intramembrane serine protease [candidate division LCP-89 bacterium B3_LCP]
MIPIKAENATLKFPLVTLLIIALNLGIFIYQMTLPWQVQNEFLTSFGMTPATLLGLLDRAEGGFHPALTFLTSLFLHGSIFHLLGNMLYLWVFGVSIEAVLGKIRFVIFYLLCGVLASVAHIVLNPNSTLPMVGASGAIAGVLGAYLITFPSTRIKVLVFLLFFITTLRISALWVLGFWFLIQLYYATEPATGTGTNVAYMAHVGGFIAGIWLMRRMRPNLKWRTSES